MALVVIFPFGDWIQAGAEWARGQGTLGLVVFAALYAVATVFAVPGSALTLIAGGAFGVASGTVAVWFGATAGLALAFLAARLLARDRVARWLSTKPSFAAVDRAVAAEGWKIVFLTRLTPVFPFTVLNYAYGLTRKGIPTGPSKRSKRRSGSPPSSPAPSSSGRWRGRRSAATTRRSLISGKCRKCIRATGW